MNICRHVTHMHMYQVESHIADLHFNGEYGLISVIGPSLGLHDGTYVISMEGDVLGRACDSAPGPHRQHTRVLEVKIPLDTHFVSQEYA
jgi:hypothetical protein